MNKITIQMIDGRDINSLVEWVNHLVRNYNDMENTMLDERRQKNHLNHLYQKLKGRADNFDRQCDMAYAMVKNCSVPLTMNNVLYLIKLIKEGRLI